MKHIFQISYDLDEMYIIRENLESEHSHYINKR